MQGAGAAGFGLSEILELGPQGRRGAGLSKQSRGVFGGEGYLICCGGSNILFTFVKTPRTANSNMRIDKPDEQNAPHEILQSFKSVSGKPGGGGDIWATVEAPAAPSSYSRCLEHSI